MKLSFYGAAGQVTGSCSVLEANGQRIVVDCGMFQERKFMSRNWDPFGFHPSKIDTMVLTHAHLDHCGLIPKLVREGFRGRIVATHPSVELARIVMFDSARIQEEDAKYKAKRFKRQKRKPKYPIVPLYTAEDAALAMPLFSAVDYNEPADLGHGITATFHEAGHVLGSSSVTIDVADRDNDKAPTRRVLFSGDVGQWDKPLIGDPTPLDKADFVVLESTYGDRDHKDDGGDIEDVLANTINDTAERGGNVIVPTFAIERAQELLFHLSRLIRQKKIPRVPVFLDSPMAINVTELFGRYRGYLDAETTAMMKDGEDPLDFPGLYLSRRAEESKAINAVKGTAIVLAGSGMCNGGRIKHHLKQNLSRPQSTVMFVGYQSPDTLGGQIVRGKDEVRIFGDMYPVKCKIARLYGMSAHADRTDLMRWLQNLKPPATEVFLNHGDADAAAALAEMIRKDVGCRAQVPKLDKTYKLES